eukprot:4367111-Alexandrium_andersonii.AAC.1
MGRGRRLGGPTQGDIDRTESIDGTERAGHRTDRTEYLPGRSPKSQNRFMRSDLELRGPRSGLKIGPRSSRG